MWEVSNALSIWEKINLKLGSLWWAEIQMARSLLSCSGGSSYFSFLRILILWEVSISALGVINLKTVSATELAIFFFYFVSKVYCVICHRTRQKIPLVFCVNWNKCGNHVIVAFFFFFWVYAGGGRKINSGCCECGKRAQSIYGLLIIISLYHSILTGDYFCHLEKLVQR